MAIPRALLVSELFPPAIGGSAVLFGEVYSRLRGVAVTVLTDRRKSTAASGAETSKLEIVCRRIGTTEWGLLGGAALRHHISVARHIGALTARGNWVVHCGRGLPEGVGAWLARFWYGTPYVCWAHGEELATALSSRELTFVTRRVYRGATAIVANSRNTARMLGALGVSSKKITVVYPGVDTTRFRPDVDGTAVRQRFAPNGELLLLSVGRFQRRKGHDVAISALAALRRELPKIRYLLVGSGDEADRLKALVAERGLGDIVSFAGEVDAAELPAYYAACDIFLLPNRVDGTDYEGFGIVFLEAAAAGKAVIGGRSGGVPEAVEEGITGLLVSGTDSDELAGTIRRLAVDPELRERMGAAGRARARRAFGWDSAAAAIADLHIRAGTQASHQRVGSSAPFAVPETAHLDCSIRTLEPSATQGEGT